jgi:hypothetical protein
VEIRFLRCGSCTANRDAKSFSSTSAASHLRMTPDHRAHLKTLWIP